MKNLKLSIFILATLLMFVRPVFVQAQESRVSVAVSMIHSGQNAMPFLQNPGKAYVQGYIRFASNLPNDVIIALDQEFFDGTNNPLYVSGGDWMGFVGVQRTGALWVAAGSDSIISGNPSAERQWKIIDLKNALKPNTWYQMQLKVDFSTRHFISFRLSGGGINKTVDLSVYPLDYPNKAPFNNRTIGYFFGAVRSQDLMMGTGAPVVYFDDMEGGIVKPDGNLQKLFSDSFETQTTVGIQPINTLPIDLNDYRESFWYLERRDSLISTKKAAFARTGKRVGVADARIPRKPIK